MDKELEILSAIKSDNIDLFKKIIEQKRGYLSLCYGRFPILSLCYLYKSSKITKEFEKALSSITTYTYIDEDYEVYKKFRSYAKRCLRLYLLEKAVVSPVEMLAVMEESVYLTEVYPNLTKNEKAKENIAKIYRINHGQIIEQTRDSIIIRKKRLTRFQKIIIMTAIITASVMILLSGSLWATFNVVYGIGTDDNPYRISNENQLIRAIEKGKNSYKLTQDITLSNVWQAKEFSGSLDGNNHTIFVKDKMINGLVTDLSGKIENLNFTFNDLEMDIAINTGLIVYTNNGVINNIRVTLKAVFSEVAEEEDVFFSCIAYENSGEINDSEVNADITFNGNGISDTYLSGIASINNGTVNNCATTETSKFITDTVDVSGIVTDNSAEGVVSGCVNNAQLKQTSASDNWLPNVGGVVLRNQGEVSDCFNYGNLTAISTATEKKLDIYVGGVVCINNGRVIKSKSSADITGSSNNFSIYAGGVASFNNTANSVIDNSCSYGKISLSTQNEEGIFLFAAGVVALTRGAVVNSYSVASYNIDNENAFVGGIAGVADYFTALSQNNYYVKQLNVEFGTASILVGNTIYPGSDTGAISQTDLEQLKGKEVYWG